MTDLLKIAENLAAAGLDHPAVDDAVIKLTNLAAHPSRGVVDEATWHCTNCRTRFTATAKDWKRIFDRCAPACPYCKAHSQYTYPIGVGGLVDKLEHMGFSCQGGPLANSVEWGKVKEALQAAALPAVPDGMVLAPHYRGYAHLGSGGYFMYHSGKGDLAELVIVPATDADREGRTVGDLSYDGPDEIPAEHMAVRLRFDNVAGLDALEQQLRLLRDEHFAATPAHDQPEGEG